MNTDQYETLVKQLSKGPTVPQWLTKKGVKAFYSIGRDRLNDLVKKGYVSSTPLSDGKTSERLHKCEDIQNYLDAKAKGLEPKKVNSWT